MSLRKYLSLHSHSVFFLVYATVAAFLTYTSMYAVRKTFTAGTFEGQRFLGVDYKVLLVTAQTVGYTLSKWIGIRIVAENTARQRPRYIIGLVLIATLALSLFAVVPAPFNILCLFLNGLPIGMIFGLVFNYLEGRRGTEILVVGLTVTQIFSSGFVKSIGRFLITGYGISETLTPFLVALAFLPILLLSVWMLEQLPPQSAADIVLKSERTPLSVTERSALIRRYYVGIIIFLFSYVLMTAYRDFRDNFAAEIWQGLGYSGHSELFTLTEIPVSLLILVMMLWFQKIKDNLKAFKVLHYMSIGGALIILAATLLFSLKVIGPMLWICSTGAGLYIAYVPANSVFFERMIAVFRERGNAGFLVIMADFYGYFGSLCILFYKNFGEAKLSYSRFFEYGSLGASILIILSQVGSLIYFNRKARNSQSQEKESILSKKSLVLVK
ncbi:DUF5690 family protein [Taibaiella koreensis]|uniref:DUF5690 family protein n=1 Tax=Taibaiella koreensis TaxID=1268548 RepID=UPI000E59F25E|nr:DUF5690 family protein [Taibaiella koreensis]